MIHIEGDIYDKFSKSIYFVKGASNLSELNTWKQPFIFHSDSDLLIQNLPGPCGVFAVVQAQIVNYRRKPEYKDVDREQLLILSLLDVLYRIEEKYVICTAFNPETKTADFVQKDTQEAAIEFIQESQFLSNPQSVLLYLLSVVFLIDKMTEMKTMGIPFVGADQYCEMPLVWIMLLGSLDEDMITKMESGDYSMIKQRDIALRVINNHPQVNGTHFNKDATLFVVHNLNHFITVLKLTDRAMVYDTLNNENGPYTVPLSEVFDSK